MKTLLFTCVALLSVVTAGMAQRKMVVRYNDGTPDLKLDVTKVDSVFFVTDRPAYLLQYHYYTNLKGLTSYIDNNAMREELVGTQSHAHVGCLEHTVDYYETGKKPADHCRYTMSSSTVSFLFDESGSMPSSVASDVYTLSDFRLALKPLKSYGSADTDYVETGCMNNHCGACSLNRNKGIHLFASLGEASFWVNNTRRQNGNVYGEGQVLVNYDVDLDLTALVETHCTNPSGQHGKIDGQLFDNNFEYRFELTTFNLGSNDNGSAFAAIYQDESGHYFLHPQDSENGLTGSPFNGSTASVLAVGRIPMVRVSLVVKSTGHVIDYGYLPVRITGQAETPVENYPFSLLYSSNISVGLVVYNNGYMVGAKDFNVITTNSTAFEKDLLDHGIDYQTFSAHYQPQYTNSGSIMDVDQYYVTDEAAGLADPEFAYRYLQPVQSYPLNKAKAGTISYDDGGVNYSRIGILKWDINALEIMQFATSGIKSLTRAVLFRSDDPATYPNIYVVLRSGQISLENREVVMNVGVTSHRINNFWFSHDYDQNYGPFQMGTDEIHATVIAPEQGDQSYMHDGIYQVWKPVNFESQFMNVFLNNFRSGTFADWLTFEGAPSVSGNPFNKQNVELAMIFDDSGNGEYGAHLGSGATTTLVVKNMNGTATTATDKTMTALYARVKTAPDAPNYYQKVAFLQGRWSGMANDIVGMMSMKIQLEKTDYAKALLNYVAPDGIIGQNVLKATVAVVPKNPNARGMRHGEWTSQPVTAGSDGLYRDAVYNSSNNTYIPIKLKDYKFDVRFLRPVSISRVYNVVIDANTVETTIRLRDLLGQFTDFRGGYFGSNAVWSTSDGVSGLDYEEYYSPEGTNKFNVRIPNLRIGDYLSQNRNVLTNLNQADPNYWVPLYSVYGNLDFVVSEIGEITYYGSGVQMAGSFQIRIPVEVEYYWGTLQESFIVTIGN